ncbi:hypothetical protein Dimus_032343 [Dionaea muscipula]
MECFRVQVDRELIDLLAPRIQLSASSYCIEPLEVFPHLCRVILEASMSLSLISRFLSQLIKHRLPTYMAREMFNRSPEVGNVSLDVLHAELPHDVVSRKSESIRHSADPRPRMVRFASTALNAAANKSLVTVIPLIPS